MNRRKFLKGLGTVIIGGAAVKLGLKPENQDVINRDDYLNDLIYNIDPYDTPLLDLANGNAVRHEWIEDKLVTTVIPKSEMIHPQEGDLWFES